MRCWHFVTISLQIVCSRHSFASILPSAPPFGSLMRERERAEQMVRRGAAGETSEGKREGQRERERDIIYMG